MITPERFIHYRVGVDCIDKDHYRMLSEMDEIISIAKTGDLKLAKEKFLKTLAFIKEHFSKEEAFMRSIGYPYVNSHVDEHIRILNSVSSIAENFDQKSKLLDSYIKTFEEIFINHIDHQDMQYSEYIIKNSVSSFQY